MLAPRTLLIAAALTAGATSAAPAQLGGLGGSVTSVTNVGLGASGDLGRPAAMPAPKAPADDSARMMQGIELSATQQTQVDGHLKAYDARVREIQAGVAGETRAEAGTVGTAGTGAAQAANKTGEKKTKETTQMREARQEQARSMQDARADMRSGVRNTLNAEQQARFDANVAAEAEVGSGNGSSSQAKKK